MVQEFLAFLTLLEGALPLAQRPELATPALARRLHAATGGIMAHVMELVRRATYLALDQGQPTIDRTLLAHAFAQRLAGVRRGLANPFLDDQAVSRGQQPRRGATLSPSDPESLPTR
jgi:hypothetical protein